MRATFLAFLSVLMAACSAGTDDGVVDVAFIAEPSELDSDGVRLGNAGQHVRAALSTGLVRIDPRGQVVPGVAERWIVTDGGASYIFRINEFDLADGTPLTAQAVRDALQRRVRELRATSLGLDLAKIRDIRAMTGRVIEIRLTSPMPDFLQLLAQPELGIDLGSRSAALMARDPGDEGLLLAALPPEMRGLPEQPGWEDAVREVRVHAAGAEEAVEGFAQGRFDLVLGGRLSALPLASTGPLSRGNVRLDAAIGLFGLDVSEPKGFLGVPENREALAMAVDRQGLMQPFNIGGWFASTRIVPTALSTAAEPPGERWATLSLEQRRSEARQRVAQWRAASGRDPQVGIYLPPGPGSDLLFEGLAEDFAVIGVSATRSDAPAAADLVLRDRVARYASPRWFLNQFQCGISAAQCSEDADYLVSLALDARDSAEEASYLYEAESTLLATNLYIPLGAPIRWSMVRADIEGFSENPWNVHPLFPLSRAPI
ncbi:ABC transporter substrate-binding protein [Qipengyuania qiaonensis]|uniref:Peptide ABC transporter substrate-binding protein n=1 Tax=Qipengyuania qiaonensis TaxID=2867240 RepID=A0ABS7J956_9SPHN|nr:ABC transporter substrate-binding protein [Qipengyuania qiaonensis]MBX7481497.1 peptide ABC transporter substrate-binding protein [Qipengyuania qiaonensis]